MRVDALVVVSDEHLSRRFTPRRDGHLHHEPPRVLQALVRCAAAGERAWAKRAAAPDEAYVELRAQSAAQLPLGYTVADSKPRSHTCSVQLVPLNPTRLATPPPLTFWAKHDVT